MKRRQFLKTTAATCALTSVAPSATPDDKSSRAVASAASSGRHPSIPKIDTHQHLWDLQKLQPPWLRTAPEILSRSYVTKDYLDATRGLNIQHTLYMEVDVAPQDQDREVAQVVELARSDQHPTCAAIISGRPASEEFEAYIRRHAASEYVRGVRQVLQVDSAKPGLCLEPQFVRSVRLLGELGKTFDLCMRPMELQDAAELAKQCPQTQLILDHCGNADPKAFLPDPKEKPWHDVETWKRGLAAFAAYDNTWCKISGIVARAPEGWHADHLAPIVDFCIETFGFDRVLFGSDWPVCLLGGPLASWVAALNEIVSHHSAANRKKLYHDNAIRAYGMDAVL